MKRVFHLIILLAVLAGLSACSAEASVEPENLVLPTPIAAATVPAGSSSGLPAAPTMDPNAIPRDSENNQNAAVTAPDTSPVPPSFQVAYVTSDDTLNVRSGPGVEFDIVGVVPADGKDIQITGPGQVVIASTWVPIQVEGISGWVNSRFLTETVAAGDLCQQDEVEKLLNGLKTAVSQQDGALLAQLVHPERGLRLRTSWWNPEIIVTKSEITSLFTSSTSLDWGVEDGSGSPITGTFGEVILPLLQADFLTAAELACDDIGHGPTAGIVRLPDEYQGTHFISLYRPAADDQNEFDWGTWVVGIEKWQDRYFISYLVHYAYEI